jgi:glycosyltransferase involved in cell wall biosynthesis
VARLGPLHTAPCGERDALRTRLGIQPHTTLVTLLPPVSKVSGAFAGLWGALILREVRPDVRLLVPGDDAELGRLRHLVRSCDRPEAALFVGDALRWPELLTIADVVLHVPAGGWAVGELYAAAAAGLPAVVSAAPAVREATRGAAHVQVCGASRPKDVAAALLALIESRLETHTPRGGAPAGWDGLTEYPRLYAAAAVGAALTVSPR